MARKYPKLRAEEDNIGRRSIPTDLLALIYARVSTLAQVGNESSRIQTEGMKKKLLKMGIPEDKIVIIDSDEGISGTKGPDERPGMQRLIELIQSGAVGVVASEHASRFFRDQTMIEADKFIELCRQKDVRLVLSDCVYDFNDPKRGRDDIQTFRRELNSAADYLQSQIYDTVLPGRHAVGMRGEWDGRPVIPGYMVDLRKTLLNGEDNPNYRKYVLYEPEARVMREYQRLLKQYKGNVTATWRHIRDQGPYLPDRRTAQIPQGFYFSALQYKTDPKTGQIMPSRNALADLFTNLIYAGAWRYSDRVVILNNHEPLGDPEVFMEIFNWLSSVDFYGEVNPDHQPQRPWIRHEKDDLDCTEPVYYDLIYSDDLPDQPHRRVLSGYEHASGHIHYKLTKGQMEGTAWCITCQQADGEIDGLLGERLMRLAVDEEAYQEAEASLARGENHDLERLEQSLKQEEALARRVKKHLDLLEDDDLLLEAEARFVACKSRMKGLQAKIEAARLEQSQRPDLETARELLAAVLAGWSDTDPELRHDLLKMLATGIEITSTGRLTKRIIVHWKDGSQSAVDIRNKGRGKAWAEKDLQRLKRLVESNADQVELLRGFPELSWHNIMNLYARHFNNRHRPTFYTGIKVYPESTRWEDTLEYRAERESQPPASSSGPMTAGTGGGLRPLGWFEVVAALRTVGLLAR